MLRLPFRWVALATAVLAAVASHAQGLGGASEAFPAGQPQADAPIAPSGIAGVVPNDARMTRNPDGSTTIQGIPMSSDAAGRLNRVLGGAVPGSSVIGPRTNLFEVGKAGTVLLGQPAGKGVTMPGITHSQSAGAIDGSSNVITIVPGAPMPGVPQSGPVR